MTDFFSPDIPSPCYVIDEKALRSNLSLIKSVKERSGVEIILAFKAFALWKTFPIILEYISYTTASSLSEARFAFEEMGSKAHTYAPVYTENEFSQIADCSSHITFNSLAQYAKFANRRTQKAFLAVCVSIPNFPMSVRHCIILVLPVRGWA